MAWTELWETPYLQGKVRSRVNRGCSAGLAILEDGGEEKCWGQIGHDKIFTFNPVGKRRRL